MFGMLAQLQSLDIEEVIKQANEFKANVEAEVNSIKQAQDAILAQQAEILEFIRSQKGE